MTWLDDLKSFIWGWFRYDVSLVNKVLKGQEKIMATLQQVLDAVTAEKTAIDSLAALTAGLKQQLADALSGVTLPAEVQAKVDAVFAGVESNKQEVLDALAANTPAPVPAPTPTPTPAAP